MKKRTFDNTDQWLAWRKEGIGASDVPKVLNLSRFGDRLTVFLEKTGIHDDSRPNEWLKTKADVAENAARERLLSEGVVKSKLSPLNCEHPDQPFIRCSLDGWNKDKVLFEHKLLGDDNFNAITEYYKNLKHAPDKPQELKAIHAQMAYQYYICCPLRMILGITHYTKNTFWWVDVDTGQLPSRIKIKNRIADLWNYIDSFKTSSRG